MISRRNFISIIMMMAVIFLLFHFSQIVIDNESQFDINAFSVDMQELPTGENAWNSNSENIAYDGNNGYVLLFSEEENELFNVVSQWCIYTKRHLKVVNSPENYNMPDTLPEIMIIDSMNTDIGQDGLFVEFLTDYGVPIVFCDLPEVDQIKASSKLREMLGIKEVLSQETEVKGIHIFDGFFLGGEIIYEAKEEKELKKQDFDLTFPWYVADSGTKVYAVGLKDEKNEKRERFPALIWRNSYKETMIFSVNGNYMNTLAGLGILDSFMYEVSDYELYPIVNAQNITITNFPGFSYENSEEMMRLYSRDSQMTFRDVMWPGISAMAKNDNLKITCLFNTQYDYADELYPQTDYFSFYLQQLKQLNSEAGIAIKYKDNSTLDTVLSEDAIFYDSVGLSYKYQALYVPMQDVENICPFLDDADLFRDTRTVVSEYTGENSLLSYLSDNVTLQNSTGNAVAHTYTDDFIVRSIQTSLGYSNVILDLHEAVWPEDVGDQWQHLFDEMTSNVHTYWASNNAFEKTTLSESDLRVRSFLNLNYKETRKENMIYLQTENYGKEAWFLLRTHEEKPVDIVGGTYMRLENNTYLIHVLEPVVKISMEELSLEEQGLKAW